MAPVKPEPVDEQGLTTSARATPSASNDVDMEDTTNATEYLQQVVSSPSIQVLEQGVKVGLKVLDNLREPLDVAANLNTTQAPQWIKSIEDLKSRSKPTRTIVGVVGNTGAGKSSVISAILDEERLLATNCMRACTASPTEISYNHSDDPSELYRAEVEFITTEEWLKELQGLYTDLLDGNGNVSRECTNEDSEAGVAYAKIKAVYPKKTKEMIALDTPEGLANDPAVRWHLGTTKKLKATTASDMYRQLQNYVDSKEKNKDKAIEFWPLIKVVRIYTKAAALATGACLVDLPGVQDSNAARAAVAANYMKQCTGLWIVAPITRAVDDKTAKSLLGDSFRRQLKYDGTYSAVTFICSKTDDISVTEAADSLNLEDQISESWSKIQDLTAKVRRLKKQLSDYRDEKDKCDDDMEGIERALDIWEELSGKFADGETVYAPKDTSGKKRKRPSKPAGSRKNRRSADSDASDFSESELSDSSDKENSQPDENRQTLTEEDIESKIASLKEQKKTLRQTKKSVMGKMADVRSEIKQIEAEKEELHSEVKAICIKGRNEYSRGAIKKDFAMGIKELDQENAAEEDEESFDPEVDLRDYDAVAESLPVFCVSSRAFQKLSGRLQRDDFNNNGFRDLEDTEIPQLQAHAKKLTEAGRASSCRRFLNDLIQLINSMKMWATNDGTQSNLSDKEKRAEETRLRRRLQQVEQELENAVKECATSIREDLSDNIFENFERYIPVAVEAAVPTATSWGAHRSAGGMYWATYKATCRRMGVFTGASGPRDFNAELFEPISKQLASGWERAFQRRLPSSLDGFARTTKLLLETFHREATLRTQERGSNYQGITMLNQQLRAQIQRISEIPALMRALAQELQRDANRNFTPTIQDLMTIAYNICTEESGPGSYMRMKSAMISHVEQSRHKMFKTATDIVKKQLEGLCETIQDQMKVEVQELYARLARDYLAVLIGAEVASIQGLPRAERVLRAEMKPLLEKADSYFEGVAEGGIGGFGDTEVVRNDNVAGELDVKSEPAVVDGASEADSTNAEMRVDTEDVNNSLAEQLNVESEPAGVDDTGAAALSVDVGVNAEAGLQEPEPSIKREPTFADDNAAGASQDVDMGADTAVDDRPALQEPEPSTEAKVKSEPAAITNDEIDQEDGFTGFGDDDEQDATGRAASEELGEEVVGVQDEPAGSADVDMADNDSDSVSRAAAEPVVFQDDDDDPFASDFEDDGKRKSKSKSPAVGGYKTLTAEDVERFVKSEPLR